MEQETKTIEAKRTDLFKVPFDLLVADESENLRQVYDDIEELADSILENGVQVPLKGYKEGDKFVVVHGYRRHRALKLLHDQGIEVLAPFMLYQRGTSKEQMLLDMFTTNEGKPLSSVEQAEGIKRLLNYGYSEKEISIKLAKSSAWVSRVNLLNTAPKKVINLINQKKIAAAEVINMISANRLDDFLQRFDAGEFTPQPEQNLSEILDIDARERRDNTKSSKPSKNEKITAAILGYNSWGLFKKFSKDFDSNELEDSKKKVFDFMVKVRDNKVSMKQIENFFLKNSLCE